MRSCGTFWCFSMYNSSLKRWWEAANWRHLEPMLSLDWSLQSMTKTRYAKPAVKHGESLGPRKMIYTWWDLPIDVNLLYRLKSSVASVFLEPNNQKSTSPWFEIAHVPYSTRAGTWNSRTNPNVKPWTLERGWTLDSLTMIYVEFCGKRQGFSNSWMIVLHHQRLWRGPREHIPEPPTCTW